eukprot:147768_1
MEAKSNDNKGIFGTGSKHNESFVYQLLNNETISESLISRGYAVIKIPTQTSFIYSSFYSQCKLFFNASDKTKQKYSQIQFDENIKSPNSLHGYSLVQNTKEQFLLRYINSTSNQSLQELKTPNNNFNNDEKDDSNPNDFGVLAMLLFEQSDILCRNIMKDVLNTFNKPESILNNILDPINKINGNILRNKTNDHEHCFGEYTLNGYISTSILDCYHYFSCKDNKYGHDRHTDSGLVTFIPITDYNPSLQVFDQKENEWINIEQLVFEYCIKNDENECEYGVIMSGECVNPYINKHINSEENQLHACQYRINNGNKERFSVVYKQRTAPLRSHARYQEDFVLAKMHSEIDVDSVHSRLMKKGTDKSKDYINYKYYEKTKIFCSL